MFKHLIVAVDGSPDSYEAARYAIELGKMCNARVTFVYVATEKYIKAVYSDDTLIRKTHTLFDEYLIEQARTEELGREVLGKVVNMAQQAGLKTFDTKMLQGNPSSEIVNEINNGDYDLAVIGRKGASQAQRSIFGGLLDPVVNLTSVPVFIVNE